MIDPQAQAEAYALFTSNKDPAVAWLHGHAAGLSEKGPLKIDAQGNVSLLYQDQEIARLKEQLAQRDAEVAELKFELEAKQRPLSEQVLSLALERDELKAQLAELRGVLDVANAYLSGGKQWTYSEYEYVAKRVADCALKHKAGV